MRVRLPLLRPAFRSAVMFSRQCVLEKSIPNSSGKLVQISWIPEQFAIKNKYLKLRDGEVWENGWQVTGVGGRKSRQELTERGRDHVNHRKGSDI